MGEPNPVDIEWALHLVGMLAPQSDRCDALVFEGPPRSKARPRIGKNGRMYSPSHRDEIALRRKFESMISPPAGLGRYEGNVMVACVFFRPNLQRIDSDNMVKFVLDSANGVCWEDDSQVTLHLGWVEYDPERPRTIIAIAEHESTLGRGVNARTWTCEACGAVFSRAVTQRQRLPRYCSRDCRYGQTRLDKVLPGQGRGPKGQPPSLCIDCGAVLAKRSFVRCRACWKIARREMRS